VQGTMATVQQEWIGTELERLPFIGHSRKGYGVTKGEDRLRAAHLGTCRGELRLQEGGGAAAGGCQAEGFGYGPKPFRPWAES
jgi:hypothetical protein